MDNGELGGRYCSLSLPPCVAPTIFVCREVLATHSLQGRKRKLFIPGKSHFAMATPPSRPSHTTVAHRGCLKQDNKTKPSPSQPWLFLLCAVPSLCARVGISLRWGKYCPWWHHASRPSVGPVSEMACPMSQSSPVGRRGWLGTTWGQRGVLLPYAVGPRRVFW